MIDADDSSDNAESAAAQAEQNDERKAEQKDEHKQIDQDMRELAELDPRGVAFMELDGNGDEQLAAPAIMPAQVALPSAPQASADSAAEALVKRLTINLLDKHARHSETQAGFTHTMKIIKTVLGPALPENVHALLPSSFDKAIQLCDDLHSRMLRIDCCVNGCCLFEFELAASSNCPDCKESRYHPNSRRAVSVFRYFPLFERIERLFAVPALVELVKLRANRDVEADRLADVYDSELWEHLFEQECGDDLRHLAFALLYDGVRIQESSQYSVYPMVLEVLNLPPWVRYNQSFLWLSGLVPGGPKRSHRAFFGKSCCLPLYFPDSPSVLLRSSASARAARAV